MKLPEAIEQARNHSLFFRPKGKKGSYETFRVNSDNKIVRLASGPDRNHFTIDANAIIGEWEVVELKQIADENQELRKESENLDINRPYRG